jgi:hypothetical protein
MKKETKLTEREQIELQEHRLNGEFDRRRLIRFGLSKCCRAETLAGNVP